MSFWQEVVGGYGLYLWKSFRMVSKILLLGIVCSSFRWLFTHTLPCRRKNALWCSGECPFSGTVKFPWYLVCCRMYVGVLLGVVRIWRNGRRVGRNFCFR